jgi:kinetochore protein Mis12/MTW1
MPLTTSANFVGSQLPALRSLLASLRPRLGRPIAAAGDGDRDPLQEERRQYIDDVARRVVQDTVGLGAEGDKERELGRRIAEEEVRALEGVVGELSGKGE